LRRNEIYAPSSDRSIPKSLFNIILEKSTLAPNAYTRLGYIEVYLDAFCTQPIACLTPLLNSTQASQATVGDDWNEEGGVTVWHGTLLQREVNRMHDRLKLWSTFEDRNGRPPTLIFDMALYTDVVEIVPDFIRVPLELPTLIDAETPVEGDVVAVGTSQRIEISVYNPSGSPIVVQMTALEIDANIRTFSTERSLQLELDAIQNFKGKFQPGVAGVGGGQFKAGNMAYHSSGELANDLLEYAQKKLLPRLGVGPIHLAVLREGGTVLDHKAQISSGAERMSENRKNIELSFQRHEEEVRQVKDALMNSGGLKYRPFSIPTGSVIPVVVLPGDVATLGYVVFTPHTPGEYNTTIYLRSNFTELVPLQIEVRVSPFPFVSIFVCVCVCTMFAPQAHLTCTVPLHFTHSHHHHTNIGHVR
jgi:hypothetical protein